METVHGILAATDDHPYTIGAEAKYAAAGSATASNFEGEEVAAAN